MASTARTRQRAFQLTLLQFHHTGPPQALAAGTPAVTCAATYYTGDACPLDPANDKLASLGRHTQSLPRLCATAEYEKPRLLSPDAVRFGQKEDEEGTNHHSRSLHMNPMGKRVFLSPLKQLCVLKEIQKLLIVYSFDCSMTPRLLPRRTKPAQPPANSEAQ